MTAPTCPGRRIADGARLGLCLLCSRLVDTRTGTLRPAAVCAPAVAGVGAADHVGEAG